MGTNDNPVEAKKNLKDENNSKRSLSNENWKRRKLIKAGAAGGAGLMTASAGCLGGNGGESSGSQETKTTVRLLLAPTGFQGIMMDYLTTDTDILEDTYAEENLGVEVSRSWEGAAIFTSGGADFETFGSLEAAKLGGERDLPLAVNANLAPQIMQVVGEKGGDYDPDVSGSAQASMDLLHERQDVFALGGWGGGTGIMMPMIIKEAFGYEFADDESTDFDRITTAEYSAVPTLVERRDAAMGTSSPIHGAAPTMAPAEYNDAEPTVTSIFGCGSAVAELDGFAAPQLNSWTCSQDYAAQYPGSPRAIVQSYTEALKWMYEDPMGRIEEDPEHLTQLGLEDLDQAQYVIDWGINLELDNDLPVAYEDIELTDEFIEQDRNFLRSAEEVGFLSEGWEENLEYRQIPTQ